MTALRCVVWSLVILLTGGTLLAAKRPVAEPAERTISAAERDHWAYYPLANVEPPEVDDARWNANPIDRFLKAKLDDAGIEPLPAVGRATLLRRVYFDLIGLPPAPAEIERFVADDAPDAFERVVDRLLASPAYGERWAQHWLDLARFAETDGFEHDLIRPHAWRYRDWVIDALNRDLPYDEFIALQLAGDQLRPDDPAAAVATGFLLCGPDMPDINLVEERRHFVLNEMTSTVGAALLGMQIGCAQCHDHKFDPMTQHDFYRLRAFFAPADIFREHPIPTPEQRAAHDAAEAAWTAEDRDAAERCRKLDDLGRKRFVAKNPDERPTQEQRLAELSSEEQAEFAKLSQRVADLPPLPELPLGRVMREGQPRPSHLYLRGDFRRPGPTVDRRVPQVLLASWSPTSDEEVSSRAALAKWFTEANHPLTARVMANRLWHWHFGRGISSSPSDFGVMGDAPSHPELLDYLAQTLIDSGWSLKCLHRQIVVSQYYRTASVPFDRAWSPEQQSAARDAWRQARATDPENQLLWRRESLRLDGESIRDAMLAASDSLADGRGGPGVRPPLPAEVRGTLLKGQWEVSPDETDHRRRSIYLFVRRNLRLPLFDVFDRPDTNASCAVRHRSTTATQSLVLLNSEFSFDCAQRLSAATLQSYPDDPAAQVQAAYLRVFNRAAGDEELQRGVDFLTAHASTDSPDGLADPAAALTDLCLALFNANEFVYVD